MDVWMQVQATWFTRVHFKLTTLIVSCLKFRILLGLLAFSLEQTDTVSWTSGSVGGGGVSPKSLASVQELKVSSYRSECWSFLCVTDSSLNCICKPEVPNWLVPIICLVPLAFIVSCCLRMCMYHHKKRNGILLPDEASLLTSTPLPMPDVLSLQNFEVRILPTYNELVDKEPFPLEDPPAYEDIDTQCDSLPNVSLPAVLMLNDDISTV
ncbi:uncharacterized protein LOC113442853 [Pseudonaja textilis]|uniref:uncharacterized protein LOC113442853 n=1 Tax=Pseudonaja textilis TaxID=8673 RepID=UPI000EAA9706|nr:uncharacterized protein LOC113442853 [Pseudonaja textilis]